MNTTKPVPPKLFARFFRWYCDPRLADYIEGDMLELYYERAATQGKRRADARFMADVLLLCRPGIIRSFNQHEHKSNYGMYKNFIRSAWRQLLASKGYSSINITGLALGITTAIFIGLWIIDELSFNKYHAKYERIAQVWSGAIDPTTQQRVGGYSMQYPVGPTLKNTYPQYFNHVLLSSWPTTISVAHDDNRQMRQGIFIQQGALDMLTLKMIKGTHASLDKMNSVILPRSTAEAIFGDEDPVGKQLMLQSRMEAEVTGVYEDLPTNSDFSNLEFISTWDLWSSASSWVRDRENDWDNRPFRVFVELHPDVTADQVNEAISSVYEKNMPADYWAAIKHQQPYLQVVPMETWHLYNEFVDGKPAKGRITYVWLFGAIGIFVLALACINFVNLATARSEKRAKEVGIRKAIGSSRNELVLQFLSESLLIVSLSFAIAMVMLTILLPAFNNLSEKQIQLPFTEPYFSAIALAFILTTTVAAGLYPAFFLSSFQPVSVLKGLFRSGRAAALPRRVLVVVQFTVSVVMIFGTLIVYQQIRYGQERPVGYNREGLISISLNDPGFRGKRETLRTQLLATGVVKEVASSSAPVTEVWNTTGGYDWPGREVTFDAEFANCNVSPDYGKTVGWEFVAGRDFSRDLATDTVESIVINQAAAAYMGLTDPIGQIFHDIDEFGKRKKSWTIIGVVMDNLMGSPYEPAQQTIYYYNTNASQLLHVRIDPKVGTVDALSRIEAAMKEVVPTAPFNYEFVDEAYALKFSQEVRVGKLAGIFAILAIVISSMGLFALTSFVAEQRRKEIGIRKVHGASVPALWQMLSRSFLVLVCVSCLVALPLGYYLMNKWLSTYQYHTGISWWIFAATCGGAFLITLATVSYQSIKAATISPVHSLRTE